MRRDLLRFGAVAVSVLALGACGAGGAGTDLPSAAPTSTGTAVPLPVPSSARLVGSWGVIAMPLARGAVDKSKGFDVARVDDRLTVRTGDGCNRQVAPLTLSPDGRVALGGLGTTQRVCTDDRVDARHTAAMHAARSVGLDDRSGLDQLVFRDDDQRIVLVLQRIPPLSMAALLGTWRVVGLGDGSAPTVPVSVTFDLHGTAGTVSTSDGCDVTTAAVELSGQYDVRFTDLVSTSRACDDRRADDRFARALSQVRSAEPDLTAEPERITLLRRDGLQVAVLERGA